MHGRGGSPGAELGGRSGCSRSVGLAPAVPTPGRIGPQLRGFDADGEYGSRAYDVLLDHSDYRWWLELLLWWLRLGDGGGSYGGEAGDRDRDPDLPPRCHDGEDLDGSDWC